MTTHINAFKWQVDEKLQAAQKALGEVSTAYSELLARLEQDGAEAYNQVVESSQTNEEQVMQAEDSKPDEDVKTEDEVSEDTETSSEVADTDSKG